MTARVGEAEPTIKFCATEREPANVDVAVVEVAVKYPTVGEDVAPIAPVLVQYVSALGDPPASGA